MKKVCTKCKKELCLVNFRIRTDRPSKARASWCKDCVNKGTFDFRAKNREFCNARVRFYNSLKPKNLNWVRDRKLPTGCNHHNWKGGLTKLSEKIRKSCKYQKWRTAVFIRDNHTCVLCFKRGGTLNADHIKRFCDYPELRLEVSNGRTLCVPCHKKTDTWGRKKQVCIVTLPVLQKTRST